MILMIENRTPDSSMPSVRDVKLGEVRRLGAVITIVGYTVGVCYLQLAVRGFGAGSRLTRLYSGGPLENAFGKHTIGGL